MQKKNDYRLITGDGKLQSSATADGVIVSGVLYITDMLVDYGIVDKENMAAKLKELCKVNKRLPKRLIEERISKYETLPEFFAEHPIDRSGKHRQGVELLIEYQMKHPECVEEEEAE